MSDHGLSEIFVTEGVRILAVLHDPSASARTLENAYRDLEMAAELLSDAQAQANALTICSRLRNGDVAAVDELGELLRDLRNAGGPQPTVRASAHNRRPFDTEETRTLRSFFRDEAHENLERVIRTLGDGSQGGPSGETLDELLRITHLLKGSAGTVGLPEFADAAHGLEDALARASRGTLRWSSDVHDAVIELIDALLAFVDSSSSSNASTSADLELRSAALASLWQQTEPIAPSSNELPTASVTSSDVASVVMTPEGASPQQQRLAPQVLRVDPRRVDRLMDSVGELTFDRTRIERRIHEVEILSQNLSHARRVLRESIDQLAAGDDLSDDLVVIASQLSELEADIAAQVAAMRRSSVNLLDDAQALRRTTAELQKGLTGIRMQSAATLFERLAPRVRAMARAEGKRVRLRMLGGETEFDKAVAEQVAEALIQLLRNAIAHGIEPSATRLAAGKPEVGLITLAARGEGESVAIEVSDDGSGLDTATLRSRLVELGVWSKDRSQTESDDEVLRAVFFPGVSSRASADLLAGRGVGLGAVRESVARLGGEIRLASTPGHGTTFTVRLPLTTAVAHALLFKVGEHVFAVPNVNVVETALVEASGPQIPTYLRTRGQSVPMVILQSVLGTEVPQDARTVPAVVIEYLGRRLAITCDKIVGPREIVVKSLGPLLASIPLYAGGTVSGSGKVQLILDPAALVRLAYPTLEVLTVPTTRVEPNVGARPRRVLVVDDSRSVRLAVTRALERAGYVVDVAPDGAAGWEKLCTSDYDVLITDLEMPELDGFGLLTRVRSSPLSHIPALIISSRATEANRARAKSLGVAEFFAKPVSPQALAGGIERATRPTS